MCEIPSDMPQISQDKSEAVESNDERLKRINLKSKRKRTLLKKTIEMS